MELFDKIKKGIILLSLCFVCLGQIFAQNVAKIGTTEYASLQAAVDDAYNATYATPTDVTIELTSDITAYTVIKQKADLNLTIDGNNKTYTIYGQIFIDGMGRSSGTETLTITGVNFEGDGTGTGFYSGNNAVFVSIPGLKKSGAPYYRNANNYAHNVTVSNCTFTSTSSSKNIAGFKIENGGGVGYNTTLTNVVGDNLHSLAQINSTDGGGAITNCTATNTKSFVNFAQGQGATPIVISGCTLSSSETESYAVRMKSTSGLNIVLSDNNFTADNVIWLGENDAPSGTINVESGNYNGNIYNGMSASGTGKIVITGGTFSEPKATVDGYCAYGYEAVPNDPEPGYCTVRKLEVAKIGTITYPSLQDALDTAHTMTGDVTIELLKDITGYSIVHQKAGLNLTIEGNDHTVAGQIIVDGDGRASGTETLAIQNIAFNDDGSNFCSGLDGFIMVPSTKTTGKPYYTGKYNYAHNITISNCSFTSTSLSLDVVGIKATSGATCYNLVVNNTTGDNLHSLAQLTATEHAVIDHCSATATGSFVNISGGSAADTISNCTFTGVDPTDGYAVRENGGSSVEVTLINNTFEAKNVLQLGKNGGSNASGHINVESGTYKGILLNDQSAAGTATFVFTGGIFDEDSAVVASWCAPGYLVFKYSDSPERWIVERAYMFVYDKNATTAVGTMDTIIVRQSATEADRTFEVAACEFTRPDGYAFDIWNTRPDSSGNGFEPGDNIIIVSDTTLYAIWKEGYTVFYDNNGGTGHIAPQPKYIGEDITLSDGAAFSRTDSTLYRWNTAADESGDSYELGGTYSADANATMYAVWRLNLDMTMSSTDVVCYGENNGTDTVKIIGGDPTYMIVLSSTVLDQNDTVRTSGTQYVFTNLKPGTYNVELSDTLKKDFITGSFIIEEPDTLVASFVSVPEKPCPLMGAGTYEVAMTSEGGNGGNVYTWGGDATDVNDTATTITPDEDDRDRTYNITVTVTDMKGCTAVIDTSFTVSPVIAADETAHSNTIMTIDTINEAILYGCDTIIRDFGTPHFTFTNPAIDENILDTIYNNVSTAFPDSIFTLGGSTILWTAVDTCGHVVTAEQVINITHKPCPSAYDFHGIEYPAVRIGCDCWTTKNLASTQYSPDGEMIPDVRSYPINTRASVYGNLYTYEAVMHGADVAAAVASNTPVQGACPEGWHVPSQAEVEALMASAEVQDLMSQGTWIPDNGTNSTGFDMLPGGFYNSARDRYERMYVSAYIWIATPVTAIYHACEFGAACSSMELIPGNLSDGYSIRCVITDPNE